MFDINVKSDMDRLSKALTALEQQQFPFAQALALTATAKAVAAAEAELIEQTFPSATPFTRKAMRVTAASKASPQAVVDVKDIQAQYLAPFLSGGPQYLGKKRGILGPADAPLNAYGNLPRALLARLKSNPNVFVGSIKTKSGEEIRGVFERIAVRKGKHRKVSKAAPAGSKIRILVRFQDPKPVTQRFPYFDRAGVVVASVLPLAFKDAMDRALATAFK